MHNLEHGGVFILYGDEVPDATVDRLRAFYDDHKTGTIMAPLDRLGDEFALGAWVVDGDVDNGFLAKCKTFDEDAAVVVPPRAAVPRARALRPGRPAAGPLARRLHSVSPGWRNG